MTQRPPKSNTPARRQAMVLQERDLDMLGSLAVARLLTVEALEWLHVPSWRGRYRAWAERSDDQTPAYQSNSNLYRRLRGLCASQIIRRVTRAVDTGQGIYRRQPDVYALTRSGATLFASHRAGDPDDVDAAVFRAHAIQNLDHAIAIGRLYAALAAELAYRGRALTDWRGDHLLARGAYDRVAVAGQREPLPVLPDATFVLDGARYVVEVDRGTRPLRSWREKVQAFEAYRASASLAARYGTDQFGVLITAPTPARLTHIAEAIVRATGQAHPGYRLLLADLVHPTTIRRGWQRISEVAWRPRQVVDRVVEMPTVTLAEQPLWESLS